VEYRREDPTQSVRESEKSVRLRAGNTPHDGENGHRYAMADTAIGWYERPELWGETRHNSQREQNRIAETVSALPSTVKTVADVGAGDCAVANSLAAFRGDLKVVAVDISSTALTHARVPAVRGSIETLPLRTACVDVVLACEVLEHLPEPIWRNSLAEIQRVAARYILVTVPNEEDLESGMVYCPRCGHRFHKFLHVRSFSPMSLRELFPHFALVSVTEVGPRVLRARRWARAVRRVFPRLFRTMADGSFCPRCYRSPEATPQGMPHCSGRGNQAHWCGACFRTALGILGNSIAMELRAPWLLALYRRRTAPL